MTHTVVCITNVLPDRTYEALPGIQSCTIKGEHLLTCNGYRDTGKPCTGCQPKFATQGEVCDRCYDRIDHALHVADTLRSRLAGIERAVAAGSDATSVVGPRLPHTKWQLDLDAIDRWQQGRVDVDAWVATEEGAREAIYFAQAVHTADRAHPTIEAERKFTRVRCPNCKQKAATRQPPDWYGDDVSINCLACGWKATSNDAYEQIVTIEARGPLTDGDALMLILINERRIERAKKNAKKGAA